MRAYFFGNLYLSSIQQGIQAAHAVVDMFVKYKSPCVQYDILLEWAANHKTMILLNGGYTQEIHNLITFFSEKDNPLPWAPFHESREALDGALTTVGIILPEEFYLAAKELQSPSHPADSNTAFSQTPNLDKLQTVWEREMAVRLNKYGLAR